MAKDTKQIPRIAEIWPDPGAMAIKVIWKNSVRKPDYVVLLGWIASGGELLAPLREASTFGTARVINYGSAVGWAEDDDLTIDAVHLAKLADEQRAFTVKDLRNWQTHSNLSNSEAAALMGISVSTWNAYKAGESSIPPVMGIALRASLRDPIIMQAHLRPSKSAGRPRTQAKN